MFHLTRFKTLDTTRTELSNTRDRGGRTVLTEPEAWREIARRLVEDDVYNLPLGLCLLVHHLCWDGSIDPSTRRRMGLRVQDYLQGRVYAYAYRTATRYESYVNKYREARALAALWLALEAEEEEQP